MFGALLGLRLMTDLTAGRPEPSLGALNFSTGRGADARSLMWAPLVLDDEEAASSGLPVLRPSVRLDNLAGKCEEALLSVIPVCVYESPCMWSI